MLRGLASSPSTVHSGRSGLRMASHNGATPGIQLFLPFCRWQPLAPFILFAPARLTHCTCIRRQPPVLGGVWVRFGGSCQRSKTTWSLFLRAWVLAWYFWQGQYVDKASGEAVRHECTTIGGSFENQSLYVPPRYPFSTRDFTTQCSLRDCQTAKRNYTKPL